MNSKNLIAGLLAGAAVGVAIGMLLAPSSGEKTRDDIAKGSRKLVDSLKGTVEDSIGSLKDKFTSSLDEATKKGKETFAVSNDRAK
jgi:gas vesicle protein